MVLIRASVLTVDLGFRRILFKQETTAKGGSETRGPFMFVCFALLMLPFLSLHYINPPEPTFLSGPYKFHIRGYNWNRQKSRVW